MMGRLTLLGAAIAALLSACQSRSDAPPAASVAPSAPDARRVPSVPAPASAARPSGVSAHAALDAMDERVAVPLLPMMAHHQKQNMRDHLLAVQQIVEGLSAKDYPAVEAAARRIGFSEQMGQMCTHMGAGAPGFTERALDFHHTADGIADAARSRDADAVLRALTKTLATCTDCHASFKQRVVDEAAFADAVQAARPPGSSAAPLPPHG